MASLTYQVWDHVEKRHWPEIQHLTQCMFKVFLKTQTKWWIRNKHPAVKMISVHLMQATRKGTKT